MSEKVQDFRGLSALLLGNQAERPGKHLQRTSTFSLGTLIPQSLYGPGTYPITPAVAMERKAKGESVRTTPCRASLNTIMSLRD